MTPNKKLEEEIVKELGLSNKEKLRMMLSNLNDDISEEDILDFIHTNYIPREEVEKIVKEYQGFSTKALRGIIMDGLSSIQKLNSLK